MVINHLLYIYIYVYICIYIYISGMILQVPPENERRVSLYFFFASFHLPSAFFWTFGKSFQGIEHPITLIGLNRGSL